MMIVRKRKAYNGIKILGGRKDIIKICEDYDIKENNINNAFSRPKKTKTEILNICKETKCKLKTVPGIYELIDDNINISHLRDVNIEDLLGRDPIKLNNDNIDNILKIKLY